ncbi:class I SAM-dependent methyltransferase, partial [bacterium]
MNTSQWEEVYVNLRRDAGLREKRIHMFSLPAQARILELGCGDGLNLKIMQELGYKNVFGLDNSFALLSRVKGVPVVLADACKTGFAGSSFDVIFIDSFL